MKYFVLFALLLACANCKPAKNVGNIQTEPEYNDEQPGRDYDQSVEIPPKLNSQNSQDFVEIPSEVANVDENTLYEDSGPNYQENAEENPNYSQYDAEDIESENSEVSENNDWTDNNVEDIVSENSEVSENNDWTDNNVEDIVSENSEVSENNDWNDNNVEDIVSENSEVSENNDWTDTNVEVEQDVSPAEDQISYVENPDQTSNENEWIDYDERNKYFKDEDEIEEDVVLLDRGDQVLDNNGVDVKQIPNKKQKYQMQDLIRTQQDSENSFDEGFKAKVKPVKENINSEDADVKTKNKDYVEVVPQNNNEVIVDPEFSVDKDMVTVDPGFSVDVNSEEVDVDESKNTQTENSDVSDEINDVNSEEVDESKTMLTENLDLEEINEQPTKKPKKTWKNKKTNNKSSESQEVEEQKGELVIIDETSDVAGDEVFIEYVEEISEEANSKDTTDEMKVAGNDTSITEEQQSAIETAKEYVNDQIEKYGQKFSIFALLIVLFILGLVMFMCVRSCRKRNARKRAQMFHKQEKEFLLQNQGVNMYEDESSEDEWTRS